MAQKPTREPYARLTETPDINAAIIQDNSTHESLIVEIAKKRDKQAFVKLFEYYAPRIKSFLMKGGTLPEQADELAQETMLTLWRRAETYNPDQASASTWIFTIARNKRIDLIRKNNRPEPDPNDPILVHDNTPVPGDMIDRMKETKIVVEAIKNLPKEQSELLHKSYYEDKTHEVIAKETKLPLGTVKSRIRLALERLRKNEDIKTLWPEKL